MVLLLALLGASLGAPDDPAWAQGVKQGRVVGRIMGAKSPDVVKGAKVVLVQFRLDAEGNPQGTPIQVKTANAQGGYVFEDVPIDIHSIYQIGTRLAGALVPSESFTFPEGRQEVVLNLHIPEVVTDTGSVRIAQAIVALEPQVAAAWITEVVHLRNPTSNVIDSGPTPLELSVPPEAEALELLRQDQIEGTHTRVGGKLLLHGGLRPGSSTIAFRYRMSAWLGSLQLEKAYPYPVDELVVLAPAGALRITSDRLDRQEPQKIEGTAYDAWGGRGLAAHNGVSVKVAGIPLRQQVFIVPLVFFLAAMGGMVLWFLRKRLAPALASPSAG
jgi:hypothetical protein